MWKRCLMKLWQYEKLYNNKYDADGDDGEEVMKSDGRNGERLEESLHYSFYKNSDGWIDEQGGRSMVCILVGCNDADADFNYIDENDDVGDREKN